MNILDRLNRLEKLVMLHSYNCDLPFLKDDFKEITRFILGAL
jgi:hypothetical protein